MRVVGARFAAELAGDGVRLNYARSIFGVSAARKNSRFWCISYTQHIFLVKRRVDTHLSYFRRSYGLSRGRFSALPPFLVHFRACAALLRLKLGLCGCATLYMARHAVRASRLAPRARIGCGKGLTTAKKCGGAVCFGGVFGHYLYLPAHRFTHCLHTPMTVRCTPCQGDAQPVENPWTARQNNLMASTPRSITHSYTRGRVPRRFGIRSFSRSRPLTHTLAAAFRAASVFIR